MRNNLAHQLAAQRPAPPQAPAPASARPKGPEPGPAPGPVQAIDQAVKRHPAPRARNSGIFDADQLRDWYENLKDRMARAIEAAREHWHRATHSEADRQGWSARAMNQAGMTVPGAAEAAKERKRREALEKQHRERQEAAQALTNRLGRVVLPDEVHQDQDTGQWLYRPDQGGSAPPTDPGDDPDQGPDEPQGPSLG